MEKETEQFLLSLNAKFGDWYKGEVELPSFTHSLYPYNSLFSPIEINGVTIKNRVVMGPMGNINMCEETGRPNQKMISYFEERASGGAGLITTGLVPVSHKIDPTVTEKDGLTYFPRIDRSRTVLAGWRDIASACHNHNAKIFIQLTAGLGRVGNPECLVKSLKFPVSASINPNFYIPQIASLRLSDCKINKIIKNMAQASVDAKACGIDGVYLHGHEGYLMEQLTNRAFNRRKLGQFRNWQTFGIKTVKAIRKRVGEKYPIMYRIDLSLALNATYGSRMDTEKSLKKFKNERRITETLEYMQNLVKAGVDAFDVDLGCYDNWWLPHPPASMPAGCFLDVSRLVKNFFNDNNIRSNTGKLVPVVAVGKLGYPDVAEKALQDGWCDMIMLARPLLADPDWVKKAYAGEVEKITPCIGCHEGCINEFVNGGHPQCAVNPRCGFEDVLKKDIVPAEVSKNCLVIGAGPSGVTACDVLLKRGHKVTLMDKQKKVASTLDIAGKPRFKFEILNYKKYLENMVAGFKKNPNFVLKLNTEAKIDEIAEKYDCIMVATGARMVRPGLEDKELTKLVSVEEVLKKPEILKDATDVAILGGGESGCETALFIKGELDIDVTVIEAGKYLMANACTANRGHILHYMQEEGVVVHNCSKLKCINDDGTISVYKNIDSAVPNPYNTWSPVLPESVKNPFEKPINEKLETIRIDADFLIYAYGNVPNVELYNELVKSHSAKEIYNIGDSIKPGKVFQAVKSAYNTALKI